MKKIKIGSRLVESGQPCFIVAEAGSNHDGKIKQAKALIDVAVDAGVDAVKFQSFKADHLFNKFKNKDIVKKLEKIEFQEEWYGEIFDYSHEKGIALLFSVFDETSADLLEKYGVTAYKIASYELTHHPLLEHIARKNKPIILSTGMANEIEVKEAVESIYATGNHQVIVLHCVSQYPTQPDDVTLNSITSLKKLLDCPVGFSDHTDDIYASIAAVVLGANMIEKHFTIDKLLPGPDHRYSLNPEELKEMTRAIRNVEKMIIGADIKPTKGEIAEREWRRAIYAAQSISCGTIITKDMLMVVRPSPEGSLSPKYLNTIIGKKIKIDVKEGELFSKKMVELA